MNSSFCYDIHVMRIAIIGAGFCGLAAAWHLLRHSDINVVIFDPTEIGQGTSGIAAGLLHPYVGLRAKLNWCGQEGMAATTNLLDIAAQSLGMPVAKRTGLLRLAISDEQKRDYAVCASTYPQDIIWQQTIDLPGIVSHPSLFVKPAITVNCERYLKGLWKACQTKGAILEKVAIESLASLKEFDAVIIAMGAAALTLPELRGLPMTPVKGQILEFQWPSKWPSLPYPLNSHAYLIEDPIKKTCLVGSTFERNFTHADPDPSAALAELTPKFSSFFPDLISAPLINCRAGIRVSTPDHRPILKKISEKYWVLSGMGSKGLLYHALMAEKLSSLLLSK